MSLPRFARRRRRSLAPAIVGFIFVSALGTTAPHPQSRATQGGGRGAEFRALVDQYRHGDADAAVEAFARWDLTALNAAATRSLTASDSPSVAAIALLHTEALLTRRFLAAARSDLGESDLLYERAFAAILELSRRQDATSRALRRDWYALNARVWAADRTFARADKLVRLGEEEFGEDADFLLAAGTLGEAEARSPNRIGEPARNAERHLRRALAIDPMLVEARVRLGRLVQLRYDRPEARRELERALADARLARHDFASYMAAMFLGQLHEEADDADSARACYESAIAVCPNAQQAYLALGHLLVASGRVDEGWAMGRRIFGDAGQPRNPDLRPWTWYYDVTASTLKASLIVMRDRVRQ